MIVYVWLLCGCLWFVSFGVSGPLLCVGACAVGVCVMCCVCSFVCVVLFGVRGPCVCLFVCVCFC